MLQEQFEIDSRLIEQNLKPRDGENSLEFAQAQIQDLLTDHAPDAFAIKDDGQGAENAAKALRTMRELRPGEWEKLDLNERARWLSKAHAHIAEQYGFQPYTVRAQALPANYGGYFNAATRTIVLNESILKDARPDRILNIIAHESRHGYQWHAVTNPGLVPADVQAKVPVWRDNFANYKTPGIHGYRAYYNQPIEVDARAFAETIVKTTLGAGVNA
jgi:hypothetical protein